MYHVRLAGLLEYMPYLFFDLEGLGTNRFGIERINFDICGFEGFEGFYDRFYLFDILWNFFSTLNDS